MSSSQFESFVDKAVGGFSDHQQVQWARWANVTSTISELKKENVLSKNEFNKWNKYNQIFMILSAAVPLVITTLTSTLNFSSWVNLLDAVFPSCVVLVKDTVNSNRARCIGYNSLIPEYEELVFDVIETIDDDQYDDEQGKWFKDRLNELTTKGEFRNP